MSKKTSLGRQKIEITKIKKKNHLQVTFSKRRSGLFKKASELCTLCGVEIAILVFSPAGKVFSFGHPNVESVISKFSMRRPSPDRDDQSLVEAYRSASVRELNVQLTQVLSQLELEKKQGEILSQVRKSSQNQYWWEKPVQQLGFHEVEQLRVSMEALKKSVGMQLDKLSIETTGNNSAFFMNGSNGSVDHHIEKKHSFNINNIATTSANPHGFDYGFGHGFF